MRKWDLKYILSFLPIGLLFITFILLNAHQTLITYTATKISTPLTLSFSGIVRPLKMVKVTSPIDGTVAKIEAKFGSTVTKGQTLFSLKSPQLQTNLRSSLTNYLRAKSAVENASFQYTGNAALYKAGLISKIEYRTSQDQYETANLTLWDATETLKNLFAGLGMDEKQITNFSMKDIDKIKTVIGFTQEVKIFSPIDGILSTQNNVSSANNKELSIGNTIKQGDTIAIIYEMTGLNFAVNIVETQLNQIQIGQKASITGVAFPSITLQGYVSSINQESNTENNTTPTYTIRIIVPKITATERQIIKEGMSAIITLIKERPPTIRIPLTALMRKDDQYMVKLISPKDGSIQEITVETGDTDETSVEITKGLMEGDQIVVPD